MRAAVEKATHNTESGGRSASMARIATPGEVDVTHGRILYLEDVHVSFDGFKAINGLNLDIAPGELRCIIGPNGAGKTTMMDIITGKTRPDKGSVFFGSHHRPAAPQRAADRPAGHRPQVPEAHGVRAADACSRTWSWRSRPHKGVQRSMFFRLDSAQSDRMAAVLHTIHLASDSPPPGRRAQSTARSSGWRSACC